MSDGRKTIGSFDQYMANENSNNNEENDEKDNSNEKSKELRKEKELLKKSISDLDEIIMS
jgi:hypothetical protein